jgi:type I restriction enzyme M protein
MADANLSSFIWSVADLLRGDYKQSEYGKVILPSAVAHYFPTAGRIHTATAGT